MLIRVALIVSAAVLVVLGFIGFGFFPLTWWRSFPPWSRSATSRRAGSSSMA